MTLFATLFPLILWFGYNFCSPFLDRYRPSLSSIMSMQRRRWVENAAKRDTPLDAILSGNIMGSVSFLASTTALLVLAIFTAFGNLSAVKTALGTAGVSVSYGNADVEIHLLVMLAIFVLSFFAFTLSLRQFNHFCILLGALEHDGRTTKEELDAIAQLNTLAAKNFNQGLRAYYFAVPMVFWFASEWLGVAAALVTLLFLVHREYFSSAHRIAASVAVIARRRELGMESGPADGPGKPG